MKLQAEVQCSLCGKWLFDTGQFRRDDAGKVFCRSRSRCFRGVARPEMRRFANRFGSEGPRPRSCPGSRSCPTGGLPRPPRHRRAFPRQPQRGQPAHAARRRDRNRRAAGNSPPRFARLARENAGVRGSAARRKPRHQAIRDSGGRSGRKAAPRPPAHCARQPGRGAASHPLLKVASGVALTTGELKIEFFGTEDFMQKFGAVVYALENDYEQISAFIEAEASHPADQAACGESS